MIIEFCCGPQSKIGNRAPKDCKVIRLTAEDDMTSEKGIEKCMRAIEEAPKDEGGNSKVLLWASMPCTGGSPWQAINAKYPGHHLLMKAHKLLYDKLWASFEQIAKMVREYGGKIANEWPTG